MLLVSRFCALETTGMFIPRAHFNIRTFMSYKGIKLGVLRKIRNNIFLQRLPLPKIRTWNEHA